MDRLSLFLDSNNLLFSQQFGFRKNTSTLNAMFDFISNITLSLDSREKVLGLFLDLSKAFDVVDHSILLQKIERLGIRGNALGWISSFLLGRMQTVEVSSVDSCGCIRRQESRESQIVSGVPQGSVLGPLLFLLFVNDIQSCIGKGNLCLFADDTSFAISNLDEKQLEVDFFIQGSSLLQWLARNKLYVNSGKTNVINFNLRSIDEETCLFLGNVELNTCITTNFLGLLIDSKLNFGPHIEKVARKLNSCIFILRRLSLFTNKEMLILAYYGCFFHILAMHCQFGGLKVPKQNLYLRSKRKP